MLMLNKGNKCCMMWSKLCATWQICVHWFVSWLTETTMICIHNNAVEQTVCYDCCLLKLLISMLKVNPGLKSCFGWHSGLRAVINTSGTLQPSNLSVNIFNPHFTFVPLGCKAPLQKMIHHTPLHTTFPFIDTYLRTYKRFAFIVILSKKGI